MRWAATNTHKGMGRQLAAASARDGNRPHDHQQQSHHRSNAGLTLHIGGLDRQISENEIIALLHMIGYVSVKYVRVRENEF